MPDFAYNGETKLKRSHLLHYIDSSFGTGTANWFLIGKDNEELSVSLNPDVSQVKNVLDETTNEDNGYTPELDVGTYYARPGDAIYPKLKEMAMQRLTGSACATKILEIVVDKTGGTYDAWQENVIVKPQEYGGGTSGVNMPYNIYFDGGRTKGKVTFDSETHAPTFTLAGEE